MMRKLKSSGTRKTPVDRTRNPKGAGRVADRPASETRDQLIASARRLFSEGRYESVKVSDLVAGAGVSQGTFYYHFADKEAALIAILVDFFEQGRALGRAWAKTEEPGPETIAAFAGSVAALFYDNQDIVRIMDGEALGHDRRGAGLIKEFYRDLYEQVTLALKRGIRLGAVRPCDARIAAVAHVGMIKEVIADQLENAPDPEAARKHIMSEIVQLIYHGVRPPALPDKKRSRERRGEKK